MAFEGGAASILKHGLLSSAECCKLVGINGDASAKYLRNLRPESVTIGKTDAGPIRLRDQKPMSWQSLSDSLTDMSPEDWLETLNSHVFFWPTIRRLSTMLGARTYRHHKHDVLILDTRKILMDYQAGTLLSTINSGATIPWKHPRGKKTFVPFSEFDLEKRLANAARESAVAEFLVPRRLENVGSYLISVETIGIYEISKIN